MWKRVLRVRPVIASLWIVHHANTPSHKVSETAAFTSVNTIKHYISRANICGERPHQFGFIFCWQSQMEKTWFSKKLQQQGRDCAGSIFCSPSSITYSQSIDRVGRDRQHLSLTTGVVEFPFQFPLQGSIKGKRTVVFYYFN